MIEGGRGGAMLIEEQRRRHPFTICEQRCPSHWFPREVAQLESMSPSDYAAPFTAAQWARLKAIFPTGVCDW